MLKLFGAKTWFTKKKTFGYRVVRTLGYILTFCLGHAFKKKAFNYENDVKCSIKVYSSFTFEFLKLRSMQKY